MGSSQSISLSLKGYLYLGYVSDPFYGVGRIFQQCETGNTIILMELINEDEQQQQSFLKLEHPNLLKIYSHSFQNIKELCTNFSKIIIAYEFTNFYLINNIAHRKIKQIPFTQEQLWALLKQLISVLIYLQQYDIYPLDLKNILLSNHGLIKLHSLQNNMLSNYQQLQFNYTTSIHLSPEELESLKKNIQRINLDLEKCQIFQIGLTCLFAASLEDTSSIFNLQEYTYSQQEIQSRIHTLTYQQEFKFILTQMLSHNPTKRGTLQQIQIQINQFQSYDNLLCLSKYTNNQNNCIPLNSYYPISSKNMVQSFQIYQTNSSPKLDQQLKNCRKVSVHIASPEQSLSKQIIIYNEDNKSEITPGYTLQTQNDENYGKENDIKHQPPFFEAPSQKYFQTLPIQNTNKNLLIPSSYQKSFIQQNVNYDQNSFPKIPTILLKNKNEEYLNEKKKESFVIIQKKSQIQERVEQALRSSNIALQQFDQTLSSAKKVIVPVPSNVQ